jgi:hypothetical protein
MSGSRSSPVRSLLRLGTYVVLGVLLFGLTRLLLVWIGLRGVAVPVVALFVALVVLEGFTYAGVLTKPFDDA